MMGFGLWKVDMNHILGRSADFLTKDVSKTSPSSGVSPGNPGPGNPKPVAGPTADAGSEGCGSCGSAGEAWSHHGTSTKIKKGWHKLSTASKKRQASTCHSISWYFTRFHGIS